MSRVVSIRLQDPQAHRLKRFANRSGKTLSEMGAQFIEESMRECEFAGIEFRDSAIGRLAYMRASTLAVWEVIQVGKEHDMDVEALAGFFHRPAHWIRAALNYYEAYPDEIEGILEDSAAVTATTLERLLPQLERADVPPDQPAPDPIGPRRS